MFFLDFRQKKCHQQVSTRNKPPPYPKSRLFISFHQMCWWFCPFIKTLANRDASWVGYTIACSHVHTEHNLARGHLPKGPRTSFDRTSLSSPKASSIEKIQSKYWNFDIFNPRLKIDFLMKIQPQEGWLILKNRLKKTRKTIEKSIENTIDFSIDFCNVKNLGWTALFSHSFNLKQTWAGQLCLHTVSI